VVADVEAASARDKRLRGVVTCLGEGCRRFDKADLDGGEA
jgi:hypothetical protein